jgi:predicted TPR repeat methyltransferase
MRVREYDLLRAYFQLNSAKRVTDALEVTKLMTELYPESANAWGRRGDAESTAGDRQASLQSYEKALKLDPNNLANLDQRRALAAASGSP